MKFKAIAFAILTALSVSAAADTESGLVAQGKLTQDLMQADSNKDGIVSREELMAAKTAEFKQADTNADTFLSWDEFKTLADTKRSNRFSMIFKLMDKDANGSLSASEFVNLVLDKPVAPTNVVFAILDQNTDSTLSPEELQVLLSAEDSSSNLIWQFAGLDSDLDGQLSVTEYTTKPVNTIVPPPVRGKKPEIKPIDPIVPPVVGAYTPIDVNSDAAWIAAKFAATQLGTATVEKILAAQSQVVSGINYRLEIKLNDGKIYSVLVFKGLDNTMKLVESKLVVSPDNVGISTPSLDNKDDSVAAVAKFAATTLGDSTGVQSITGAKAVAISSTIKQFVMTVKLNNGKTYAIIVNQTTAANATSFKLVSYKLVK
jgi:Ca2+-binding EF-hand superfamily protein